MTHDHALALYSRLLQDRRDGTLCDVNLVGTGSQDGDDPIRAHKIILKLESPYFSKLFKNDQLSDVTVRIPISHNALAVLIEYIYSGLSDDVQSTLVTMCHEGSREDMTSLMTGAQMLRLTQVLKFCDESLQEVAVTMENCLDFLHYNMLKSTTRLNFINANLCELIERQEFFLLDHTMVQKLLETLSCPSRHSLQLIVNWWNQDPKGREDHAVEFLTTVPLTQMNTQDVLEIVANAGDELKALALVPLLKLVLDHKSPKSVSVPTPNVIPVQDDDVNSSSSSIEIVFINGDESQPSSPSESTSPLSSTTPKKSVKRKYSDLEQMPFVQMGKRIIYQPNCEGQWSLSSHSHISSTTTTTKIRTKSKFIMYYIGEKTEPGPLKHKRTKYYISSFDFHTGKSKSLKSFQPQEASSLVFYNNSIYIVVGRETGDGKSKPVLEGKTLVLDLIENGDAAWRDTTSIPLMPYPIYDSQTAVLNDVIYSIGGARIDNRIARRSHPNDFWVVSSVLKFSPNEPTQGWTKVEDGDGQTLGSYPKCAASIAVMGDTIYSIGGFASEAEDKAVEASNIVESFHPDRRIMEEKARFPVRVVGVATAVLGSKLYALGGGAKYNGKSKSARVYDTETNTWTIIETMNKQRRLSSAVGYKGFIYVIGGDSKQKPTVEKYNPVKNKWTMCSYNLPPGDFGSVAFNVVE